MSADILNFVTQYTLYSGCIISTAGTIGSVLNILVFTQLKLFRGNRCIFYLIVESISNLIHQFLSISTTILTSIYGNDATGHSLGWCRFRYMLSQTLALTTYYMVCLAAVDQFFSTNYYFNLRQMCTLKLARCLTCTLICIWIGHSITIGLFFNVQLSLECTISNRIVNQYSTFFFYPILAGLLPIVIAVCFGFLAFRNVRHIVLRQLPIARRRLDRQITAMVLIRAVFFICFISPYTIYRIYAINSPNSSSKSMAYAIKQLIQAICLSLSNLNYTVKSFDLIEFIL
jgi:hypothetical protein